jgi:hypothetical protein
MKRNTIVKSVEKKSLRKIMSRMMGSAGSAGMTS